MLISRPVTFSVFDARQTHLVKFAESGRRARDSNTGRTALAERKKESDRTLDGLVRRVGVTGAALVLGELDAKTFLGIGNPLHRSLGHFEFSTARSAHSDDRNHAQPFQHSEIALYHQPSTSDFCSNSLDVNHLYVAHSV